MVLIVVCISVGVGLLFYYAMMLFGYAVVL